MAKLNGVKTVDMVNGEITKVAYEGAEYVKVATGFAQAQTGDIFLSQGQSGETSGAFYEIKIVENGDNHPIKFVDDEGSDNGYMRNAPHLDLFRKISADKPTLEQRVETLESDVAALKSSDSSLKGEKKSTSTFKVGDTIKVVANTASHGSKDKAGFHEPGQGIVYVGAIGKVISVKGNYVKAKFAPKDVDKNYETLQKKLRFDEIELAEETIEFEGATYRKVEREAREGDVVIFKETGEHFNGKGTYITVGKPYKASFTQSDGRVGFIADDSDDILIYGVPLKRTRETVDVYEPIEQAKYVPQEGDIVVITGNRCDSRNAVGDIGKITKVKSYGINVEVPSKPNSPKVNGNSHPFDEVRKATPAEVEKYEQAVKDASKPKLKAGDYVKFKHSIDDTKAGKPYLIEVDLSDGELSFKDDAGDFCDIDFSGEYEILSAEEAKWAKIGRNIGELRKGDIVRITDACGAPLRDGDLIEVISDSIEMSALVKGYWAVCSKLITPVNSRFNA